MLLIYEIKVHSHICVAILQQKINTVKNIVLTLIEEGAWQGLCLHDDANDNIVLCLSQNTFTQIKTLFFLNLLNVKTYYHSRMWCLLSLLMTFLIHGIGYSISPDNAIITPIRMKPEL